MHEDVNGASLQKGGPHLCYAISTAVSPLTSRQACSRSSDIFFLSVFIIIQYISHQFDDTLFIFIDVCNLEVQVACTSDKIVERVFAISCV
ncbi:hypothetical protein ACFPFV_12655 [Salinicoccus siamensis]|uniref:hypothetical protein n=1 Tax=Salinicoccus siamensis TaxID=381830 RepID=UPI003612B98C